MSSLQKCENIFQSVDIWHDSSIINIKNLAEKHCDVSKRYDERDKYEGIKKGFKRGFY